jgi:UTP:GlnB (protein PII) uridylyltransferase
MTAHRTLTETELAAARDLLADIRARIDAAAGDDERLRFALNRKVYKELSYDERGKPNARASLKARMVKAQNGDCAQCAKPLPDNDTVLDRLSTEAGYVEGNVRVLCRPCDLAIQRGRGFA